jgi:hypothetical protein
METVALTGIASHGCGENRYWWIIPTLFTLAIIVRAIYRAVTDRRDAKERN